ncbi:uncharacterized protein LOC128557479 isoform X1 [Mercenaria mercenaria]|uniref:uncharacterized protein LOC128557479 isoform X1 n=1 Tax=Mercenaria mercenaria TaxID=6596 RepID=UPI00234E835B|nr:uncharacterized protein LOC128557479 isoform X1 [Mercenaria mercenaria]
MASAAGLAVGLLLLIIIIVCGVLLWYYYKKRKQREVDKLPLQKAQPANKRLVNGDLYRDGRVTGSKTPRAMNGDVKVNVEDELGVRRENSIHISMTSRGGSGLGGLDGDRRQGVAPVEEPEVNYISDDVIIESENEATLASTFLPISTDEKNELHFTDEEIKAIEKKSFQKEEKDSGFDMDEIDDELGLPRLSRAFTPVIQPEEATLPTIAYKKINDTETESDDERRADGIKKVKLKKHGKKKKRVRSAKENVKGVRVKSGSKTRSSSVRETPFLDRLKKQETETAEREHREKIEREMKEIENEVIKARVSQGNSTPATIKSKSSRRTPRPHEPHPVINTWWTEKEVKAFNDQIKDLQQHRHQESAAALATPQPKVPEKIVKEHQGSDILWKYKEIVKKFKTKKKASKRRKNSGKTKKGQEADGGENTLKPSPYPHLRRTRSTTETTSLQGHPLSLKPEVENLQLE